MEKIASVDEYSRGGANVVEAIFQEVLEHDTALANLLKSVDRAPDDLADSAKAFQKFDANNKAYYDDAGPIAQNLLDSAKRKAMRATLDQSSQRYDASVVAPKALLSEGEELRKEMGQLRILVMLDRTLERIEDYQKQQPASSGIGSVLQKMKTLRDRLKKEVK